MKDLSNPTGRRVIVLDTSALVAGLDPFLIDDEQYTVDAVRDEIAEDSTLGFRLKTAEESGRVKIENVDTAHLEKAKHSASEVGDLFFLSEADLQVLALAIQLKSRGYSPLIATDDYSIQNVAKQVEIAFAPLATFGIRRRLQWLRYCPACHRTYPANYRSSKCEVCGTQLKRKPARTKNAGR